MPNVVGTKKMSTKVLRQTVTSHAGRGRAAAGGKADAHHEKITVV